jgi:hypothetical protein
MGLADLQLLVKAIKGATLEILNLHTEVRGEVAVRLLAATL